MELHNSRYFTSVYEDLGVNLDTLGCVMLDTENPIAHPVDADAQYFSPHPDRGWIAGLLKDWHVTVRYGFLPMVREKHILHVLGDSHIPRVRISNFNVWPSPYPEEDYECIVARVESVALRMVNTQLSVLPNISTFVTYAPHITVGYFKRGWFADNGHKLIPEFMVECNDFRVSSKMKD